MTSILLSDKIVLCFLIRDTSSISFMHVVQKTEIIVLYWKVQPKIFFNNYFLSSRLKLQKHIREIMNYLINMYVILKFIQKFLQRRYYSIFFVYTFSILKSLVQYLLKSKAKANHPFTRMNPTLFDPRIKSQLSPHFWENLSKLSRLDCSGMLP